jgi:hypothetical protein
MLVTKTATAKTRRAAGSTKSLLASVVSSVPR